MPVGLKRLQHEGHDHFITFSCHDRSPLLSSDHAKRTFLHQLETLRERHEFLVFGYALMPEHVHLLLSEPKHVYLENTMRVLKVQTSRLLKENDKPFWLRRYYDFNVFTWDKRVEKLKYMHRNPVKRGLCEAPEDYPWSSYRHYALNEPSPVQLAKDWIAGWQRS